MSAEDKLRKLVEKVAENEDYDEHNIEMKVLSTNGANYTSILYLITVSAPNKKHLKLFAKVANISEELRNVTPITSAFENEWFFYNHINNIFEELEETRNVPKYHRFITPKLYGCSSKYLQEILILEDLSDQGYMVYDRKKPISWDFAAKAVEHLTKFHALSFAYCNENPKEFNKLKDLFHYPMTGETIRNIHFNRLIFLACETVKEEYKDKMRKYFEETDRYEDLMAYFKPATRAVLSHGDYRGSNLMHRYRDGKLDIIVVDYQTLHVGCPAIDVLFLIYTGSDAEFRKLYYKKLVEYYYNQLNLALQNLNVDINEVYPRECYDKDLKKFEMYGLYVAVTVLAIVTVDAEDAPEATVDVVFKASQLYQERMNSIVQEYIQKGLL